MPKKSFPSQSYTKDAELTEYQSVSLLNFNRKVPILHPVPPEIISGHIHEALRHPQSEENRPCHFNSGPGDVRLPDGTESSELGVDGDDGIVVRWYSVGVERC